MSGAWQTPRGARPNREGIWAISVAQCVPARCAKLPGRSLEPVSNGRPRGMTVSGGNAVQNSAYRSGINIWPSTLCGVEGHHVFHSKRHWVSRSVALPDGIAVRRIARTAKIAKNYRKVSREAIRWGSFPNKPLATSHHMGT